MKSLEEVVQFYTRGADFRHTNLDDLDPDVNGISELQGNPAEIAKVVEFLKHLTDPRVRYRKAPFDHPELVITNGHIVQPGNVLDRFFVLPATGRNGGQPLGTFEQALESGSLLPGLDDSPIIIPPQIAPSDPVAEPPAGEAPSDPVAEPPAGEAPSEPVAEPPAGEAPADPVAEPPAGEAPSDPVAEAASQD